MTTNYERIKSMSVEEMAKFLYRYIDELEVCVYCPHREFCRKISQPFNDCDVTLKLWLESEVENEK